MAKFLFDPGYSQHLVSLVLSIEDIYSDIRKYKNFGQKKFQFNKMFPTIVELVKQNVAFYLGCLLWAVYVYAQEDSELVENYCLGKEYNEQGSLLEVIYAIAYVANFPKEVKYYTGKDYKMPDEYLKLLTIYYEFAKMNKAFVEIKRNKELVFPKTVKTPTEDELKKIKEVIDKVVKTGDFDLLFDVMDLIM